MDCWSNKNIRFYLSLLPAQPSELTHSEVEICKTWCDAKFFLLTAFPSRIDTFDSDNSLAEMALSDYRHKTYVAVVRSLGIHRRIHVLLYSDSFKETGFEDVDWIQLGMMWSTVELLRFHKRRRNY
jgi:hypothetical protein